MLLTRIGAGWRANLLSQCRSLNCRCLDVVHVRHIMVLNWTRNSVTSAARLDEQHNVLLNVALFQNGPQTLK